MRLDLTGHRFGRLTVMAPAENKNGLTMWLCKCDCGKEKTVRTSHLRDGKTKSCGCLQNDRLLNRQDFYKKEFRIKRLYRIWHNMMLRCNCKKHNAYKDYGGRGVSICEEWNDYENFAQWALTSGYGENLTIDRINTNGNYEPSNCRWITIQEQNRNKRNSKLATINGVTLTIAEWAKEYGMEPNTIYRRTERGMTVIDALTKETRRGRPNHE